MPKSIMEEMEGVLAERKTKRKARTLKEHVQRSRTAIGGTRMTAWPRERVGGLRAEMLSHELDASSRAYSRSAIEFQPDMPEATQQAKTRPYRPPAKEFRHAKKAIRVHRNVIKAGEKGIRVSPKAMARRMSGRIAMLSKAGKPLARRLPFIGGLLTAGSVAKGLFDNPSDAGRVIAREAFGINLPEKKRKKRQ